MVGLLFETFGGGDKQRKEQVPWCAVCFKHLVYSAVAVRLIIGRFCEWISSEKEYSLCGERRNDMLKNMVNMTEEIHKSETGEVRVEHYTLTGETRTLKICPGDLYIICNVLHDYTDLLREYIGSSELEGDLVLPTYEYYADRCKNIQLKIEDTLGYSTEEAIERCQKKRGIKTRQDDVGEDSLLLVVKKRSERRKKQMEESEKAKTPENT